MLVRRYYRYVVILAAMIVAAPASIVSQGTIRADGVLYDLALGARAMIEGDGADPAPVVVVAVDQDSLDSPELRALPRALFSPHWATLTEAAFDAGATAVGFDLLFAWSASGFLPDHDRPFLAALNRHRDKVVLGRSATLPPARPFYFAAGAGDDPNALGFVEVAPDSDGVHRRVPIRIETDDGPYPGFTGAVAAKAGLAAPTANIRLAPYRPMTAIPTYALVDVLRCAGTDALAAAFAGRIVLVGSMLPDEDRKLAPDRYLRAASPAPHQPASTEACALDHRPAARTGGTVPGVLIHAEALAALAAGRLVSPVPVPLSAAMASLGAGAGALLAVILSPLAAVAAAIVLIVVLFGLAVLLLMQSMWLPIALPMLAVLVALGVAYAVRYLVEDRKRRQIQIAFGHYLAPAVVDRLADAETPPALGGENSQVSIMFADLSGFTALSGTMPPDELMTLTNRYLGYIAEAVEATGGYVDKFIGDAVMAIWGAPANAPDHATQAVRAARRAIADIEAARARDEAGGGRGYAVKIGINSGTATVGNVGWARRVNYTAVGEVVNLAARLESVPGDYDCRLVVGAETRALAEADFAFCELDLIRVKGKHAPVAIFEPVAARDAITDTQRDYLNGYAAALAAYRAGDFVAAARLFAALDYTAIGTGRGPPQVMAQRAAAFVDSPPDDWDGVWVKPTK